MRLAKLPEANPRAVATANPMRPREREGGRKEDLGRFGLRDWPRAGDLL
jgi:hypothetical protein